MSELKTLLDAYSRGESTLESVKKCLARYLTGSPEHKAYALRELKDARGLGLSQNTFDALTRALSAGVTGAKVSSPESPKAVAKAVRPATDGANTHDSDRTQPETVSQVA